MSRNVNEISHSNTVFSRLSPSKTKHLTPLSVYSRIVMDERKHSPGQFSSPFVNLQVEIVNNCVKKRKLDDSSLNRAGKKPCRVNPLSPDLGCFPDYCSPHAKNNSPDSFPPSLSSLNVKSKAYGRKIQETVSSRPDLVNEVDSVKLSPKSEQRLINISGSFDYDVDDILCLNPLRKDSQKETNKESKTDLRPVEEDKGYVSSFHQNESEKEHHEDSSPEPQCHGKPFTFSNKDSSTSTGEPVLLQVKSGKFLEEEDEILNIGQPIFESSVCQPNTADEQKSCLSDVFQEPFYFQSYNHGDSTVDTSYETTLPLKVQVKSEVFVPNQSHNIFKRTSSPPREQKANKNRDKSEQNAKHTRSERSRLYDNEPEWERQKRQYVYSVTSHMSDNRATAQGLMTELLDLMTHVARQTGSNGPQWQHPADLTCRNYQKRFGNMTPTMTLGEWQAKNSVRHKRFCRVSKIFERSPFP